MSTPYNKLCTVSSQISIISYFKHQGFCIKYCLYMQLNNIFTVNKYLVWNIQQVSLSQSKNTRKKNLFWMNEKTWCTKHSLRNVKKCSLGVKCQLLIIYFCKIHEMHHVFFASSSWLLMGELFCSVLDIIMIYIRAPLLIFF